MILTSCATRSTELSNEPILEYSTQGIYRTERQPGCMQMYDSYCNFLYSPEALGNLSVSRGGDKVLVQQGQTNNDFSNAEFEYLKAKLRNRSHFPTDFLEALEKRTYFEELKTYLTRKPRKLMNLTERVGDERADLRLESIWQAALTEAVLRRVEKKFSGYHKMPEDLIPIEMKVERRRIRRHLIAEISHSIWRQHPNWKKVESNFELVRENFLEMIQRLKVPEELRQTWKSRISSVRLKSPGSMPEISDDECASTKSNAYYYPYLNVLTVCAGDFNSEDIVATLAHELAHSLDVDRSTYLFQIESRLGKELKNLSQQSCSATTFDCGNWKKFKQHFSDRVAELREYQVALPAFQQCLQPHQITQVLSEDDVERFSRATVNAKLSNLAESDIFLRITKERVPMPNGKTRPNPNYLNPCSYYLWTSGEEPIHDELTTLVFFNAEYRCSDDVPTKKLKNAIEVAREMTLQIEREVIDMEGPFSSRHWLANEGFASSPTERFADVMGSYALANLLMAKYPTKWQRRNAFLASGSWQCTKPSLANQFPEESAIQRQYIFESHTGGDERQKEFFTRPIQEALSCEQDFHFKSCELQFDHKEKVPYHTPIDRWRSPASNNEDEAAETQPGK